MRGASCNAASAGVVGFVSLCMFVSPHSTFATNTFVMEAFITSPNAYVAIGKGRRSVCPPCGLTMMTSGKVEHMSAAARFLIAEQAAHPLFYPKVQDAALSESILAAQDEGRMLTDREIDELPNGKYAIALRNYCAEMVDEARARTLQIHKGIAEEGGKLYPAHRAETCWRDLELFVGTAQYALLAGIDGVNVKGAEIMVKLYEELDVPIDAMCTAIETLRDGATRRALHPTIVEAFDRVLQLLGNRKEVS